MMPSIEITITLAASSTELITVIDSQVLSSAIPLTLIIEAVLTTPAQEPSQASLDI